MTVLARRSIKQTCNVAARPTYDDLSPAGEHLGLIISRRRSGRLKAPDDQQLPPVVGGAPSGCLHLQFRLTRTRDGLRCLVIDDAAACY